MQQLAKSIMAAAILGIAAGCTSGNGALEPPFTSVNLQSNKLQLAVGVATFADGTTGLNTVTTFRQPDGLSATLLNTPTLTGPFTVPAGVRGTETGAPNLAAGITAPPGSSCKPKGTANVDAGTSHITGSPQALPGIVPVCSTFGQAGGVFAYGFAPINSTTTGAPSYAVYMGPFYGSATQTVGELRGGPPAYPTTTNGLFDPSFTGYTLGFTTFALPPVAGAYNLSVNVPSGNNPGATIKAPAATLTSTAGLPPFAAPPTFVEDGTGGGTATCTTPAGTTETLIDVLDTATADPFGTDTAGTFYTLFVATGGTVTATLPDNLGPTHTGTATPSIKTGDAYQVDCIAADYPLFQAGPPANTQQTPAITGTAGQSDIAFSPLFVPPSGVYSSSRRPTTMRFHHR